MHRVLILHYQTMVFKMRWGRGQRRAGDDGEEAAGPDGDGRAAEGRLRGLYLETAGRLREARDLYAVRPRPPCRWRARFGRAVRLSVSAFGEGLGG